MQSTSKVFLQLRTAESNNKIMGLIQGMYELIMYVIPREYKDFLFD